MMDRTLTTLHSLWLSHTYPFQKIGKGVSINRPVRLDRRQAQYISIGDNVLIMHDVWINIPEVPHDRNPVIVFEDGCVIGQQSVISAKNKIEIGRDVLFGPSVLVMDHNHAFGDWTTPIKFQGTTPGGTIRIEEGAWIGFGAAIVCDSGSLVIGRNAVISANALVTGSVAPYTIVVGNPGRPVKHFDPSKNQWLIGGRTPPATG
jgi:acetyltransferase-like isoleucine patch superfamily enzyme